MWKSMKKVHRILLIMIAAVTIAAGIAGGYVFYVLPHKKVAAKPMESVMIPIYFARYTQEIQTADQKVTENVNVMHDGSQVTARDLHGFFQLPLHQKVVYQQVRVPGDRRDYRNGIHQGTDLYQTKRGDPIYAMAPGVVIRIDKDYKPVDKKFRDEILKLCDTKWKGTPGSVGTPPVEEPYGDVLDKLRGRQVILYHGKNAQNEPILSLYAHTLDVNHGLAMGDLVTTETIIGYIGNTGTSGEADNKPGVENHVHFELFVGGMYWTPKAESEIGKKQAESRYVELQKMILLELSKRETPSGWQSELTPTSSQEGIKPTPIPSQEGTKFTPVSSQKGKTEKPPSRPSQAKKAKKPTPQPSQEEKAAKPTPIPSQKEGG
jgi:murein DD-endopeptidase MepM/ murein hydrolase activator NlpD